MNEPDPPYVEVIDDGGGVSCCPLGQNTLIIGREPGSDLPLDGEDISRRHAELSCDDRGRWSVRDLDSQNGIVVNSQQVSKSSLDHGDTIAIGGYRLRIWLSHVDFQAGGNSRTYRN